MGRATCTEPQCLYSCLLYLPLLCLRLCRSHVVPSWAHPPVVLLFEWNWNGFPVASQLRAFILWRYSRTLAQVASLLRFLDHTRLDTRITLWLPWTSDQLVAEAATYTVHNNRMGRTSLPPSRTRIRDPINRSSADHRTATGISPMA